MKSKALIKLMIVCLVVFGFTVFSNNLFSNYLVQGINKAKLDEKMTGEVRVSRVASNFLETESSLRAIPPYNFLWPLWKPALSPKDLQTSLEIPLVISFFGLNPWPPPYLLDWIIEASIPNPNLLVIQLKAKTNVKVCLLTSADIWGLPPL